MNRAGPSNFILISALAAMLCAFLVALGAQTASPHSTPSQPTQSRSVWDGVYTEKQAERGERLFRHTCSSCHGDQLTGNAGDNVPALTGKEFQEEWSGRTVGDMFRKILKKMPQDDPGTLTPQESVDTVAFLLSFNKFPDGKTELPPDNDALAAIHIDAKKPDPKKNLTGR